MNIFYCPLSRINSGIAEFDRQESRHASRVLRFREGDDIRFVDGEGGRYGGKVSRILRNTLVAEVTSREKVPPYNPRLILGMGIIKKRDRLEFAVEKATELGAGEICLFRSEHTVKENVRMDRLEMIALSAMKQSLRAWLPPVKLSGSLEELLDLYRDAPCLAAREKRDRDGDEIFNPPSAAPELLLLVGPEGGFSGREIEQIRKRGGDLVSLGGYRLRTETAAVAFMSRFLEQ